MHVGHFRPDQNLLMHSVIYTQVLRDCGMVLPSTPSTWTTSSSTSPLPYVKSMYYMNAGLYRYFIGRSSQSVNEAIMVKRVDQPCQPDRLSGPRRPQEQRLRSYMLHYLSMMMAVGDIFLLVGSGARAKAKADLWSYARPTPARRLHTPSLHGFGGVTNLNFPRDTVIDLLTALRRSSSIQLNKTCCFFWNNVAEPGSWVTSSR